MIGHYENTNKHIALRLCDAGRRYGHDEIVSIPFAFYYDGYVVCIIRRSLFTSAKRASTPKCREALYKTGHRWTANGFHSYRPIFRIMKGQ
jgi:hypothetical protein